MSLLDRPPHRVLAVLRDKTATGTRGESIYQRVGEPTLVRCMLQPVREWSTAEEIRVGGIQLLSLMRLFARHWPGNMHTHVIWEGQVWETVGDPQHWQVGKQTRHWELIIRRLGEATPADMTAYHLQVRLSRLSTVELALYESLTALGVRTEEQQAALDALLGEE